MLNHVAAGLRILERRCYGERDRVSGQHYRVAVFPVSCGRYQAVHK